MTPRAPARARIPHTAVPTVRLSLPRALRASARTTTVSKPTSQSPPARVGAISSPPRDSATLRLPPDAAADRAAAPGDRSAWYKAWYPIAAVENLDPGKPNALELMGEKLVAWKPGPDAAWVVQSDRCPHRSAPLTDGFISRSGEIVCAYHGYRFTCSGACSAVTALSHDAKAEATARASKRARVRTLPTVEASGLLFVWPDPTSPDPAGDAAAAAPPPVHPALADESVLPLKNRWYQRYLPYDMSFHLENVLCPGHPAHAHRGTAGLDATKLPAYGLEMVANRGAAGFMLRQRMVDPSLRAPLIHFEAPSLVWYETDPDSGSVGMDINLAFYSALVRPGCTIHFSTTAIVDPASGSTTKVGNALANTDPYPAWVRHLMGHEFVAGDALSLSRASTAYAKEGRDWRASYWLPSSADLGIVALRRWMDDHGGGPDIPALPPAAAGVGVLAPPLDTRALTPAEAALDVAPVEVLLDRYNQHTKHCASCRGALANTRTVAACARAVVVAALALAVFVSTAAAQAGLSTAATPAGWAARAAAAVVRATHNAPFAAVAACAVVAVVAAVVALAARALEKEFLYVPFDREKHRFA